jgi:biotin carboxyl carrier protein
VALRVVESGMRVEKHDKIIEIESMKTFWPVTAPCAGIVRHRVELGEVVGQDQVVATIETE